MVKFFEGRDIDKNVIEMLKNIVYRRYTKEIYNEYFCDVEDVNNLACLHGVSVDNEKIIIGTDWFLCYAELDYTVEILEWVAIDNGNKFQQVAEMMKFLKKLFLQNKEKLFIADMRHDTSYAIYLKMLQNGFFQEFNHKYLIDCAAPNRVQDLKMKFMNEFDSIKDFLASDVSSDYAEYHKYILHHLSFMVTDKFIKRYGGPSKDFQRQILKKKNNKLYL